MTQQEKGLRGGDSEQRASTENGRGVRPVVFALALGSVVLCGTVARRLLTSQPPVRSAPTDEMATPLPPPETSASPLPTSEPEAPAPTAEEGRSVSGFQPSAERARELMGQLAAIGNQTHPLTKNEALGIQQTLAELRKHGPAALDAIREYFGQQTDLDFRKTGLAQTVGAPTLRQGLLGILGEIPGPEAVEVAAEALKASPFPEEIAKLMGILETGSPGAYRQEGIAAARNSLALAALGEINGERIAPAFEVLQTYGGADVLPDLQNALNTKWRQNAAIALAELPNGIGIDALVQFARDPETATYGKGDVALRPLAQVAPRYPEAFSALLDLAAQNKIRAEAWPTILSGLAGNDYISNGQTQPETRPPASELNALLGQRISLLDRLANAVTDPTARQFLANQRASLANRTR